MSDTHMISQLKFKISSLEVQLHSKQKIIQEYQTIEKEADGKIKGLTKIHADKVKTLLNSIQILKKEKASIEGLSKEHKRSKLIQQLNKEIADQDLAINVLRKHVYEKEGKDKGRLICDDIIVKALTKGPQQIRPLSRQQLKIEIGKLKSVIINLQSKLKNGSNGQIKNNKKIVIGDDISMVSQVSQQSYNNMNEDIYQRIKQLHIENENLKLEVNGKVRIIQKLKSQLKDNDKIKIEIEVLKNQIEIAEKKVSTYEKILKESKESTNNKIIDLYEREIKVEELEMVLKQNSQQLKHTNQAHSLYIEELKLQREQLQTEYDKLKHQNERIIMQNITGKNRHEEQKNKILQIRDINVKQKNQLGQKLSYYEKEIENIVKNNQKYQQAYRNIQTSLFKERAQWVQQKAQFLQQITKLKESQGQNQLISSYMQELDELKRENKRLLEILQSGGGGDLGGDQDGDNKILLQRLDNYKRKIQYSESKGQKTAQSEAYEQMFEKYNEMLDQLQQIRQKGVVIGKSKGHIKKQIIEISKKQNEHYKDISSGISQLNLDEIDSDILDNFNTSYQYQIRINQNGQKQKHMAKVTNNDRQLLKMISSDLWGFMDENQLSDKIQQAVSNFREQEEQEEQNYEKIREITNLNHPQGYPIKIYKNEIKELENMNDEVSVTSAIQKQLDQYNSDVNIKIQTIKIKDIPNGLHIRQSLSQNISSEGIIQQNNYYQNDSNLYPKNRIQKDKGNRLKLKSKINNFISDDSSYLESLIDSEVSSIGIDQADINLENSDISGNFQKKKK